MSFTHEQVAHLNHMVELMSATTLSDQIIAGFTTTGDVFTTGNLAITSSSFRHSTWSRMQIVPRLDDDCEPVWPGASFIYFQGFNAWDYTSGRSMEGPKKWYVSSRSSGTQVRYQLANEAVSDDLASWTIIPRYIAVRGTMRWCVTIFSGESNLCVTVGQTPSDSTQSDNTQLFLTDYSGNLNQLFILTLPHTFGGGVYGLETSLTSDLAAGPYASALTDNLPINMQASSAYMRGQAWRIVHRGCLLGASTQEQQRAVMYYPARCEKSESPVAKKLKLMTLMGGILADGQSVSQQDSGNAFLDIQAEYPGNSAPYDVFIETFTQYGSDDDYGEEDLWSGNSWSKFKLLTPSTAGLQNAQLWSAEEPGTALPQTPSTKVIIRNSSQEMRWTPTPRNFYDRSLSVPQMLRLVDAYGNDLGQSHMVSAGSTIKIFPQAICNEDQLLTVCQMRSLDDSTGEWTDWETLTVDGEVTAKFDGGVPLQYQEGTHNPVWIPNAWLGDPDQEGRRTQTQGYQLGSITRMTQIRVSMRSFAYGSSNLFYSIEADPFVGDAAVTTLTIAPIPAIVFSDGTVDKEGFHIPYAISRMTTPVSVHISHLLWSSFQMWTSTVPDYVRDFETTLSTASGTIDIPWTAASLLPPSFASLSYSYAKLAGTLVTSIGVETFERSIQLSHSLSELNISTTDTSIYQQLTAPTIFGTLTVITHAFAQVDSEFGPRVIKLDYFKQNEILWPVTARPDFNASSNGYTTTQRLMLFSGSQCAVLTPPKKPSWQHIPSLTWMTHDLFDTAHIILLRGDPEYTTTLTGDATVTRRWNSKWKNVEVAAGVSQDTRMTATLYSGQTSMTGLNVVNSDIRIHYSTRDLASIPADTPMILQTSYGVTKIVKLIAVDVPRSQRDRADVTLTLEEVESL